MTPLQIELARHALGLPNKRNRSYRNHFVAGPRHEDFNQWVDMVTKGFAKRRDGNALTGFWLTPSGANAALKKKEVLDPEDFPVEYYSVSQ